MNKYSGSNFKEFVSRMESSLGAKRELLVGLDTEASLVIVDFGSGSGLLGIQAALDYPNSLVYLVERNLDMQVLIKKNIALSGLENVRLVSSLDGFTEGSVDVFLLSSVLHEVYADAGFNTLSVIDFLKWVATLVVSGGVIRIREGLESHSRLYNYFEVTDLEHFREFVDVWFGLGGGIFHIKLDTNNGVISGTVPNILEFLNKYTWGVKSLPREISEKVLLYTYENWLNVFTYVDGVSLGSVETRKDLDYLNHISKLVVNDCDWDTHIVISLDVD